MSWLGSVQLRASSTIVEFKDEQGQPSLPHLHFYGAGLTTNGPRIVDAYGKTVKLRGLPGECAACVAERARVCQTVHSCACMESLRAGKYACRTCVLCCNFYVRRLRYAGRSIYLISRPLHHYWPRRIHPCSALLKSFGSVMFEGYHDYSRRNPKQLPHVVCRRVDWAAIRAELMGSDRNDRPSTWNDMTEVRVRARVLVRAYRYGFNINLYGNFLGMGGNDDSINRDVRTHMWRMRQLGFNSLRLPFSFGVLNSERPIPLSVVLNGSIEQYSSYHHSLQRDKAVYMID